MSKIVSEMMIIALKQEALEIGAFDVVAKPFDFDELLHAINVAIKKK